MLTVLGISRKSWAGAGLAAVGALLVYGGATAGRGFQPVQVRHSCTVLKPVGEVYRFWRAFENLPKFMQHLDSVKIIGERSSHWIARAPVGLAVEWDAEITDERENQCIAWRSTPGSQIQTIGSVEFRPAPGNRGTELHISLRYDAPGGHIGQAVAAFFGESPEQQIREDLRHFKQLMEAGEIPTIEGQSHGRRTVLGKAAEAWARPAKARLERALEIA